MSNMDNATQPLDADNLLSLAGKITRIKVSVDDISVSYTKIVICLIVYSGIVILI